MLSGKVAHSLAPPSTQVALLSTLRHPNIVRYVGTLRENRTLYIFLEFVPGGSIASMLARFGRFDETIIRLYTRQILEGLAYLHESRTVRAPTRSGLNMVSATNQATATGRLERDPWSRAAPDSVIFRTLRNVLVLNI